MTALETTADQASDHEDRSTDLEKAPQNTVHTETAKANHAASGFVPAEEEYNVTTKTWVVVWVRLLTRLVLESF
jgi:hypothetical protein